MNKKTIRKILGGFKSYIPGGVSFHPNTVGTSSENFSF
jgi:hypothetical protein